MLSFRHMMLMLYYFDSRALMLMLMPCQLSMMLSDAAAIIFHIDDIVTPLITPLIIYFIMPRRC